jgi:predicted regulator of Ras-like GTPase activity (Roadblock/LC7/MglB family)
VSLEGLMLASALPAGTNEDAIAAMSATVLALGERTTREFAVGSLEQVYFKGSDGYILIQGAGEDGVLVVVTDGTAKLGVMFLLLRRTSEEIRELVKRAISPQVFQPAAQKPTTAAPPSAQQSKPQQPTQGQKPANPWST